MGRTPNAKKERDIIEGAIRRLKLCVDADKHNRDAAIDDLNFVNGDQWDPGEKKRRADQGRPALQFNLLPKFVDQVVGDMLHTTPQIKVRPVDSRADINIAKIRQGIISNVEYCSNSKSVYGYGGKQMVSCGYGGWRVLTRYTDENPSVQECYLESVRNPFLIYLDPAARDQNYADAKYGFLLQYLTKDEFEETYPGAQYPQNSLDVGSGSGSELWYTGDAICVAEYFTMEQEIATVIQLETGEVVSEDEFEDMVEDWRERNQELLAEIGTNGPRELPVGGEGAQGLGQGLPGNGGPPLPPPPAGQPSMPPPPMGQPQLPPSLGLAQKAKALGPEPKVAKKRETKKTVIRHRVITAFEILDGGLEGNVFPGKFIPLVLLKGKELNIEGKNYVYSLIRHAKDPQKMVNYWNSAAAESIALAPKAPWLGTAKQFEGYENDYAGANVENFPFLKYNVDPEAPGPPQRQMPAQPPVAIFEQIRRGEENIKSVIGMFNADIGAPDSRQTGAAVTAGQRPGDIATYEFQENLSRAILHTGRILNEMIPEVYDTERDVRVRNTDDTETFVPVNTTLGAAAKRIQERPHLYEGMNLEALQGMLATEGRHTKFNDITTGRYNVVITTGPSYATQRQEAAQHLLQLTQTMPEQMAGSVDLIVRNMDFKDADELEERLRKPLLASGVIQPKPGEAMPPPPRPSPRAQADMMEAQARQKIAEIRLQAEQYKVKEAELKYMGEVERLKAEARSQGNNELLTLLEKDRRYRLDADRLSMEKDRLRHQKELDTSKQLLDAYERLQPTREGE